MAEYPVVTVIIPTYNRRELVVQATRSVLAQTFADLECLVIDNGSTDGTPEALAALGDARVRALVQDRPTGGPAARNLGMAEAKGSKWVAFLDSDDLWAPDKLERQVAALARHPEAQWSATSSVAVGEDLRVRHGLRMPLGALTSPEGAIFTPAELRVLLEPDNRIPAGNTTVVASSELLAQSGGFDPSLVTCDDWDLWLRLAAQSPITYIDLPLAAYRLWDGQSSSDEGAFMRDAATVRARNLPEAGPLPQAYISRWDREAGRRHVAGGRRVAAARSFTKAAWGGRAPGQLAYAAAALTMPALAEKRLRQIEGTQRLPAGWADACEPWLAPFRAA
jgi:glycosyltransferase involved in cell wall biosynthesis